MQREKGVDWTSTPPAYKFGTFMKRQKFRKQFELSPGQFVEADRIKIIQESFQVPKHPKVDSWFLARVLEEDVHWNKLEE